MSPEAATQDIMMRRPRADKRAVRLGIVIENGRLIKEKIEASIPVASFDRPAYKAKVGNQVTAV